MLQNKKVIAVCMAKLHDAGRSEYIQKLHYLAQENNCKLLIFNSFIDFYNQDALDQGAASVYSLMNFDLIDGVVVLYDSFVNHAVADRIIANARAHHKPVILINGQMDGCWSIMPDYSDTYTALMEHVITAHGIRDTFFIAGPRGNDESDMRIACYQKALEHQGIPFEESRVDYGDFWDSPTRRIVQRLVADGQRPPRAIFCANDYMAFTVVNELAHQGYSVPGDVVVTGFDGVPASEHFQPQLTTCREDNEYLAQLTIQLVEEAMLPGAVPSLKNNTYTALFSESCGCKKTNYKQYRESATNLFNTIDSMQIHEDYVFAWIDRMLEIVDMNALYATIQNSILGNSCVCMNSDFVASMMEGAAEPAAAFSNELIVIPSVYSPDTNGIASKMSLCDMVPDLDKWIRDDTTGIINAVYVGAKVCGYFVMNTDDILGNTHKIKRVTKAVNIAFTVAVNYFRQQNMNLRIQRAAYVSAVTGMPNMKGAVQWFETFSEQEENHRMSLTFSVYGLPKYRYILENYGVDAAEEALRVVAEALKTANPKDCHLAQIAEDAFAVINYYADGNQIGEVINKATSVFFSMIESYNSRSEKEYFVEVNCGCTVVNPGWTGALESFIKFAYGEMYMNQIKHGAGNAVKAQSAPQKQYTAFSLLLEKNLFHYHFQPIVHAKTGDIYAYEALMRTDQLIGMNPLEVLDAARQYNRLYDIEKATLFNIMDRYARELEQFGGHKVFINTIPGHFLSDEDRHLLADRYGGLMSKVVFELTEQDTVSDAELSAIKELCGESSGSSIAIDDYGTGHSNIVNLMRYAPQVIKIDRYLIEEIHKNPNKQMFVRSTIEFARLNQIMVLAEGVETSEEMRMAIDLGVDLIQGYYTGRPAPDPIGAIKEEIRQEIIAANPLNNHRA
ncbi:MAG: EAL domain-containing protein [Clostridiales bacterium]|nr:EAL domain-containing protein [Clostridiales bacterium]